MPADTPKKENAAKINTSPGVDLWWTYDPKKRDELLILRQENSDDRADVIYVTLGQAFDLALDLVADFAGALDHDDALQAGPVMVLLKPVDVVEDGDVPGLDASVIAIGRPMVADDSVLERTLIFVR